MKDLPNIVLKSAIILIGILVLCVCIRFIVFVVTGEAGMFAPILLGMCVSAIPFFIALREGLTLLELIKLKKPFSDDARNALRIIQIQATIISIIYVFATPYVYVVSRQMDAPGLMAIGIVIGAASFVVATFAALLNQLLRSGIELQNENELTV